MRAQIIITFLFTQKKKLALCVIPKVASTTFARLFNAMNYGKYAESPKEKPMGAGGHSQSSCVHLGHCEDVTSANGWTIAVFGRNPIERYVSAFRSKCLAEPNNFVPGRPEKNGTVCYGSVLWDANATLSERVEAFEAHALNDVKRGSLPNDVHWVTQTLNVQQKCGLQRTAFNFFGSMDIPLLPQIESLLQRVKHPNASVIIDDLSNKKSHCTTCSPQDTAVTCKALLRSSEVVDGLMHLYADDYNFFEFRATSLNVEDVAKIYAMNQAHDKEDSIVD